MAVLRKRALKPYTRKNPISNQALYVGGAAAALAAAVGITYFAMKPKTAAAAPPSPPPSPTPPGQGPPQHEPPPNPRPIPTPGPPAIPPPGVQMWQPDTSGQIVAGATYRVSKDIAGGPSAVAFNGAQITTALQALGFTGVQVWGPTDATPGDWPSSDYAKPNRWRAQFTVPPNMALNNAPGLTGADFWRFSP